MFIKTSVASIISEEERTAISSIDIVDKVDLANEIQFQVRRACISRDSAAWIKMKISVCASDRP